MPIDYSTYHPNWKKISVFIRFYRAKNKCEWCGAENYEPHPLTGSIVILTVAHIDHDKNNNSFFNLAALCQRCHLHHDRHEHKINRFFGRGWKERQINLFNESAVAQMDRAPGVRYSSPKGCDKASHE